MLNNQIGQLPGDLWPKSNESKAAISVRKLEEIAKNCGVFYMLPSGAGRNKTFISIIHCHSLSSVTHHSCH